ncbi:hypothetical protein HRR83_004808 [Exophiala dermatitidis]|uniref:Uncharacterized protein n=1 Tax=Exophiala dermatitidis TaxID=5970 RepID=A0AAN6F2I2_EXODE|nr:hypothetical protein HRR74_003916 [Exophiala dermatitidis]KAJ4528991.1 hypothetical protein HRR73_000011 [Exophiala dermatitidis]KAJ4538384.1 hypothetical protein HRR77_006872 [Exophiala dermatitidis]KAJ4544374.1 hypothetical protein HRR76_002435 [Exophiala dermatitidis]KAJ4561790.1 hypothetical protein HRR79_007122 [Exophiala dermatitidis]
MQALKRRGKERVPVSILYIQPGQVSARGEENIGQVCPAGQPARTVETVSSGGYRYALRMAKRNDASIDNKQGIVNADRTSRSERQGAGRHFTLNQHHDCS